MRTVFTPLFSVACIAAVHAKDYTFINQLPQKLTDAHVAEMRASSEVEKRQAANDLNDKLKGMIKQLLKIYYPKNFVTPKELDAYFEALLTAEDFKDMAGRLDPSARADNLQIAKDIAGDLEQLISKMVEGIVDEDFNYPEWKKRWEQAAPAGD